MAVSENSRNFAPVIPEKRREEETKENEQTKGEQTKGTENKKKGRAKEKRHTAARKNNYMPFIGK